jgi:hypothetical protein
MATPLSGYFETPNKASRAATIGAVLGGFGAGMQGRGQEHAMGVQQQQQALELNRQKAMAQDAMSVYNLLGQGKYDNALGLIDQRVKLISELGGDPSDTLEIRQLITSGRIPEATQELESFLGQAMQYGLIEPPAQPEVVPASAITNGQVVTRDRTGGFQAQNVPGYQQSQPEEYTLSEGQVRMRGGEVVAQGPERAQPRDTARENRVVNIAEQLQSQYGYTPERAQTEARNIADGNVRIDVLESGQVRRVNLVNGEVSEVPVASQGQEIPVPQTGRTLYDLASQATGPMSAVRAGLARVGVPNDSTVTARTEVKNAMQELTRALAVNPRFPVAEIERIRADTDLDPAILDNPTAMRARMRGLESYLSRRQAQAERDAADPSLPQEVREGQASNASSIRNFRAVMGVPQTLDADFLSTPQAVQQLDTSSLRYFAENASDEDLNALPDEVAEAIIRKLGGGR